MFPGRMASGAAQQSFGCFGGSAVYRYLCNRETQGQGNRRPACPAKR